MAAPGWYPDPGGAPDRYRYWDGTTWSSDTSSDARPPTGSGNETSGSRRQALLLLAGVAVLILIIAVVVLVRNPTSATRPGGPLPSSSVGGWDDSSPFPTPSPSPTRSADDSSAPLVSCPFGIPSQRESHPADDRVHGGNMSFPTEPSFEPATNERRLSFAYDVAQQTKNVNPSPSWIAQLAVGQLRATDGFTHSARNTAESVVACSISGDMYAPYGPTRKDIRSEKVSISGHAGWLIEMNITVSTQGLPFPGDHVIFIVVEDGDNWGLFFGAAPIGDGRLNRILKDTVQELSAS